MSWYNKTLKKGVRKITNRCKNVYLFQSPSILPSPTDSTQIQVESGWNGRNGWNVISVKTHPNFTQTWTPFPPNFHQIPTKFPPNSHHSHQNHSDLPGSNSYQDPSRFQSNSTQNLVGFPAEYRFLQICLLN